MYYERKNIYQKAYRKFGDGGSFVGGPAEATINGVLSIEDSAPYYLHVFADINGAATLGDQVSINVTSLVSGLDSLQPRDVS